MISFGPSGGAAGPAPGRGAARDQLRRWTVDCIGGDEDDIALNELTCAEEGCPPKETCIHLLDGPRKNRKINIHKALMDCTEDDVRTAWAAELGEELGSAPTSDHDHRSDDVDGGHDAATCTIDHDHGAHAEHGAHGAHDHGHGH